MTAFEARNERETRTGVARATIVTVAKAADVSPSTASNALTGRRPVDDATRAKVLDAAARLGYRPNLSARKLRSGGASIIAIFSSTPFAISAGASRLGFMMEIAGAASLAALEYGVALLLAPPLEKQDAPVSAFDIDGAIVIEPSRGDPYLAALAGRGIPTVTIGRVPGGMSGVDEIDLQSRVTAEAMLATLAPSCQHIALVIGDAERNSFLETEAAYRQFCDVRGQRPVIVTLSENAGEQGAFDNIKALLANDPAIDGLLVLVDTFATGAVRAAAALGRVIPRDLRIITRYNGPRAMESDPPLSAVDLHLGEFGAMAVEQLMQRLGRHPGAVSSRVPPAPVVILRSSTGAS
jgi:DNA-binding LacI/PurR family transcriptional regulator